MTSSQPVEHIGTLIIILVSTDMYTVGRQTQLEDTACDLIGSRETVRYGTDWLGWVGRYYLILVVGREGKGRLVHCAPHISSFVWSWETSGEGSGG